MTLRVVDPPRVASNFQCAGDTRGLSKPFVPYGMHVCVCRGREKRGERVEKGGKLRERDTRTQRRISGVPLLRSRYDARRVGFALISDTSEYRAVCLTQIDPVE